MRDTSVVEIDLSAVAHNVGVLRRMISPQCRICAVVKADAYGLGAPRIARCLVAAGVDLLAVYTPQQAAELFRAAVRGPVLVLMPVREIGRADDLYRALVCGRLHLSVHDPEHLQDVISLADRFAIRIPVHLELDTGMSRGGCNQGDAPDVLQRILDHPRLRLVGIYTQYTSSNSNREMTQRQTELLEQLLAGDDLQRSPCLLHAANTCAAIQDRRYHQTMIRIGQAWAGYGVEWIEGGDVLPEAEHLQPSVTWSSSIVQLKRVEQGTTVGYGGTWRASRRSVIGLVPVGFADGFPLALGGRDDRAARAEVAVIIDDAGWEQVIHAPVVGAVNMDQITIDLTDIVSGEGGCDCVPIGTRVELISPDRSAPNHLVNLARLAGTNPYEILCRLNPRLRRVYHYSGTTEVMVNGAHAAVAG